MYHHIRGTFSHTIENKDRIEAVVEAGGVGYLLRVPRSTFGRLPAKGDAVELLTSFVVRNDAMILYGFATEAERTLFGLLLTINKVGPQNALTVLSGGSVGRIVGAIRAEDDDWFKGIKGIGPKTASRIVLELKEAVEGLAHLEGVAGATATARPLDDAVAADALGALLSLGHTRGEAERRIRAVLEANEKVERDGEVTAEEIVRDALRV